MSNRRWQSAGVGNCVGSSGFMFSWGDFCGFLGRGCVPTLCLRTRDRVWELNLSSTSWGGGGSGGQPLCGSARQTTTEKNVPS